MQMLDLEYLIRPNILQLIPYRCARDDYEHGILLDANENSLGHSLSHTSSTDADLDHLPLHRYPSPSHPELKQALARLRGIPSDAYVFLGVGSDEIIDLLIRITCIPGSDSRDAMIVTPPTYGMYTVCAQINDVRVLRVPLLITPGPLQFTLDLPATLKALQSAASEGIHIKLLFVSSPGNPTGTLIHPSSLIPILESEHFKGLLVVDEAYIDFAPEPDTNSAASLVTKYPNLVVMQTLSKSFGLAAIRLGVAFADPRIIQILTNTKAPYNVSLPTATLALRAFDPLATELRVQKIKELTESRTLLTNEFKKLEPLGLGKPQGGSHANFLLMPIFSPNTQQPDNTRAKEIYRKLAEEKGVVVRYRGGELGCEGCLRITIGTSAEIAAMIHHLREALIEVQ